jgi:sulfate adenylyltransferase subunit 2
MTNSDKISFPTAVRSKDGKLNIWDTASIAKALSLGDNEAGHKAAERAITTSGFFPKSMYTADVTDEHERPAKKLVLSQITSNAKRKRQLILVLQYHRIDESTWLLFFNDGRMGRRWIFGEGKKLSVDFLEQTLSALIEHIGKDLVIVPTGNAVVTCRLLARKMKSNTVTRSQSGTSHIALELYSPGHIEIDLSTTREHKAKKQDKLTHLDRLEAESIHIIREVMAESDNPVMLYSVGKDSAVMLHLARKAFYPSPPPFPLLHVDTRWKFQAMYDFRDYMAKESSMDLLVHINPDGVEKNINPLDHGSAIHTDIMKTEGLKQALNKYKFDAAFGGARRDEEKSRAKERVFSFRTASHRWDPKNQRPELWNLYNGRKQTDESIRVFPISNWTELDIWQYIYREQIPIVPLYFAAERPVVERDGMLLMVDDDRLTLYPDEKIEMKKVRFRTLGCYPLTGAIESDADDMASIILELLNAKTSERQGRAIDSDSSASMEKKKQEGYF